MQECCSAAAQAEQTCFLSWRRECRKLAPYACLDQHGAFVDLFGMVLQGSHGHNGLEWYMVGWSAPQIPCDADLDLDEGRTSMKGFSSILTIFLADFRVFW